MRICLIGGIYAPGGQRGNFLKVTPETTLETGLRAAGHQVTTLSHYDQADFGRFDAVHVHHLSYGAIRLATDPSHTPFVFTAHDSSRMNGQPQTRLHRLGMPFVLSRADAVVALSDREAGFQRRTFSIEGALQATIPNGIDAGLYTFQRTNSAGREKPWQLLFAGQLIPLKGVDLLIRAMALLPENVELNLVYQGSKLEAELKALAAQLGLAARIQFLGRRDPAQLAALYQQSDLLVLPSATEALPSVITEAMLCGLPFVATAVGGIPEQADGFGRLLQRRTPGDLANAIRQVLLHYSEFEAAGEAMSESARRRFAIEPMIRGHIELYAALAASHKDARRHHWRKAPLNAIVRTALRRQAPAGRPANSTTATAKP